MVSIAIYDDADLNLADYHVIDRIIFTVFTYVECNKHVQVSW